jgi:hypothetical protein
MRHAVRPVFRAVAAAVGGNGTEPIPEAGEIRSEVEASGGAAVVDQVAVIDTRVMEIEGGGIAGSNRFRDLDDFVFGGAKCRDCGTRRVDDEDKINANTHEE